jgi:hypothetical protein
MGRQSIITAELPGSSASELRRAKVAILLRDNSMRVLEASLAIGALATALLLGLVR